MTDLEIEKLADALFRRFETSFIRRLEAVVQETVANQVERTAKEIIEGMLGHIGTRRE